MHRDEGRPAESLREERGQVQEGAVLPGQEIVWRNDIYPRELPTVETWVIHAEDLVKTDGFHGAFVLHIDAFHGKGFGFSIRYGGSAESRVGWHMTENGGYIRGQTAETYAKVQGIAEAAMDRRAKELADSMAADDARAEAHRKAKASKA